MLAGYGILGNRVSVSFVCPKRNLERKSSYFILIYYLFSLRGLVEILKGVTVERDFILDICILFMKSKIIYSN